jgi:thymidylate kinase
VSFSGLDGAGKSSQIEALVANLAEQDRSTEVLWLPYKYWPGLAKNAVPLRLRRKLHPRNEDEVVKVKRSDDKAHPPHESGASRMVSRKRRGKAVDGLRSGAWAVTGTLAAISAGTSLRQRMSANTAEVLVLDRYRLDSLVKLRWAFPALPQSWLAGIVRSVAPAPDLEVLFRVEPEVAYARKAEQWNVGQLAIHASLYDELASGSPTVVTLDAARNPDDIARDVWARVRPLLDDR